MIFVLYQNKPNLHNRYKLAERNRPWKTRKIYIELLIVT